MSEPVRMVAIDAPGSPAAVAFGCRCPVMDNGHGRGYMGQAGIFVYSEGCPVHWPVGEAFPGSGLPPPPETAP